MDSEPRTSRHAGSARPVWTLTSGQRSSTPRPRHAAGPVKDSGQMMSVARFAPSSPWVPPRRQQSHYPSAPRSNHPVGSHCPLPGTGATATSRFAWPAMRPCRDSPHDKRLAGRRGGSPCHHCVFNLLVARSDVGSLHGSSHDRHFTRARIRRGRLARPCPSASGAASRR